MCCADTNVGGYCQRETLKQMTATEKAAADDQTALTGLKAFSLTAVPLLSIRCAATTARWSAFTELLPLIDSPSFLLMVIIVAFDRPISIPQQVFNQQFTEVNIFIAGR